MIRNYHAALRRPVEEFVARNQGRVLYGSRLAPLVFVQVPKGLILGSAQTPSLELRPDVETLYLSREYKPALNHSASAINADNFWNAGTTGSGIKTAVIEPFGIAYAHPNLPDGIYCNPSNVIVDDHPTKVAGVINSYHPTYVGIAFGAPAVLSGNSLSSEEPQIISCSDWAIDQGANVLNYSLDLNPYGEDGQMGALDVYTDHIVRYNAVTVAAAAGNIAPGTPCNPTNPYVTAKGFNVLAVGAFDDRNTATSFDPQWGDDIMWEGSCWKDPVSPNNEIVDFTAPSTGTYTALMHAFRFDGTSEFVGWARLITIAPGTTALFRIERATGNVYTDGSFYAGGADLAEHIFVSEPVEPGDVVELDPHDPRKYRKARGCYSPLVAGVISTHPGMILGAHDGSVERPLLALIGRVPVKATTENGPIRPGDLLTSSSKPGYAMHCEDIRRCEGAIIGKALESLTSGDGMILMLAMQ